MSQSLKRTLFSALLVILVSYPILGLKLRTVGIKLEVLGADAGDEQGLHPVVAGHAEQAGVAEAGQAGDHAEDPLYRPRSQLHQHVHAEVPGGAYAVGDAEEDQPGEQGLGQGDRKSVV